MGPYRCPAIADSVTVNRKLIIEANISHTLIWDQACARSICNITRIPRPAKELLLPVRQVTPHFFRDRRPSAYCRPGRHPCTVTGNRLKSWRRALHNAVASSLETSPVFGTTSSRQSASAKVSPQSGRVCGVDNKAKFRLSARMACTREVG